jgi:ankyrin repeat protein
VKEKVETNLAQAVASGNEVAMSGAMNVFKAMGRELPGDSQRRIMQRFQDPDFREQGITEIKSLFFPLTFDMTVRPKFPTGASCFPHTHRQDINEKAVGVRSWARECKQDFAEYLASQEYRHTLYRAVLHLMDQHGAILSQPRRDLPFDSGVDRFIHCPSVALGDLTPHERDVFIGEILERDMLDEPTEAGFTLLQLAVCRGDLVAATTLLEESFGTDINACGETPNWTPLWLACFLGYHEMAVLLISHDADLNCQDSVQGITVLHLLSQFSSKEEVEGIGYQALAAGVDVSAECQNGVTPLLASMLVFDYSDGAAARFLLDNGASPLVFTTSFSEAHNLPVSPLSLCILNLDTALLEAMLSAEFPSWPGVNKARAVTLSQAVGFQLMHTKTAFRAMFETGENYKTNLKSILQMVVRWEESRMFYWTPLAFAFDIDRADLIELLLAIDPSASLDLDDSHGKLNMLEQCVVRHNFRCVKALVRHGADVLESTKMRENVLSSMLGAGIRMNQMQHLLAGESRLSRIAKDMPSILGFVLDHLDSLPAETRGGLSVRSILESWQVDTAGIFDTLVIEGNSEELAIAEALRVKYRLGHDRVQPYPPNTTTLMGALIVWSDAYGYGRLDQVRYLLSLEPKPRFHLPSKINLLQLALIISEGSEFGEASQKTEIQSKLTKLI